MKSLLLLALGLARTVVLGARIEAERIVVSVRPYKREQRRCPVCGLDTFSMEMSRSSDWNSENYFNYIFESCCTRPSGDTRS